jgi:hypothetical protein
MKPEPGLALIYWQTRRNRRAKGGLSGWTALSVVCLLAGFGLTGAQAAGWLHLTGTAAMAPAGLVLFAIAGQLVTVARAMVAWLRG